MVDLVLQLREGVEKKYSQESLGTMLLWAADEIERLRKQLPEDMKYCTIVFKQCEKGHGWLTATNWVQHDCQRCKIDKLKEIVATL